MSNELTRLLPCPFCGNEDIDLHFAMQGNQTYTPGCMSCGGSGPDPSGQSESELAESWNRRALEPSPEREGPSLEALRIAKEALDDPDKRAKVKVELRVTGWPKLADLIDEMIVLATEIVRLASTTPRATEQAGWEPIADAPMYVYGRDALVGQHVSGFGWKKVTIWEREWTRDQYIERGATHWWPHLRDLPLPPAPSTSELKEK